MQFERIIQNRDKPQPGEEQLAALTAGERAPWAEVRSRFFSSGANQASLAAIERAAFFVTLDEESHGYEPRRDDCLDRYAKSLLHGNCCDRYGDTATHIEPHSDP
ncbi:carnitine O-palmitoyltransferase 1, muscle isoform-like [Coturnix japonica]|uniref:carnitine O-palmitoyltransferase 1, muscle isoform-like n=1 Tax=Coturnix japonica TaxID=93934 RepID=UPI00077759BA|nr:carnitine O-palmitoyltransferase 1, muscle isoform-like [Coturnix japonica]